MVNIKPYFSNKGLNSNKIFISEGLRLIQDLINYQRLFCQYHTNYRVKHPQPNQANKQFEEHTNTIRIKSNLHNVSEKFNSRIADETEVKGKSLI